MPRPRPPSQTLSRGIRILEILADAREPLSIDEIARRLGVHRSVAYRLLRTLEDHGLVTRDGAGRIQLGARMAALAAGRRARPAGRGPPRAHRGRERARHDVLPRRARSRRVRHARRASSRGTRSPRSRSGRGRGIRSPSAHPARRSCRCCPPGAWPRRRLGPPARRGDGCRSPRLRHEPRRGHPEPALGVGAARRARPAARRRSPSSMSRARTNPREIAARLQRSADVIRDALGG